MTKFSGYQCSVCGKEYTPETGIYTCPADGGNLDILYDYPALAKIVKPEDIFSSKENSIWRYEPLLPVNDPGFADTPLKAVGWTPLYQPQAIKEELALQKVWIKDESRNPTASFKDRASAIVIARAKEIGAEVVVTASTGNAGAALAGMAAAARHQAVIFAPKSAPPAKIAQLLVFGAQVYLVDGNYDQAFDLSVEAANAFGWYCRNTGYNPFTAEGKKTAAFEIWEQILTRQDLKKPLCVFVPVGDGNIISGIHKGFKDLLALGWIKRIPRIFGIQSEGSAAIARAFETGSEEIVAVRAHTIADSISVDFPRDGLRALRAVTQTCGAYIQVSDQAILTAIATLGKVGIFAEPAASAAFAGLQKAVETGMIVSDDPVLVINTGSGLKDAGAAQKAVSAAPVVRPSLSVLKEMMR